jgi:hypothetical protein
VSSLQHIRGPVANFVDSLYYSESELCVGVVTVSFSKYLPWQAMHFLQRSTPLLENLLQTVDHLETSCLGAPFSWLEKPRNRMRRDLDCMADVLMGFHRSTFSKPNTKFNSDLAPCDFWISPTMKRSSEAINFEVSRLSRRGWIVRSASLANGCSSKKRPSPHLHKVPTRSKKASPRTLQTALVYKMSRPGCVIYVRCRFLGIIPTLQGAYLSCELLH